MALEEGANIPDVELTMSTGEPVKLGSYVGKPFVLYFYPKDDTPGCTREAQDFSGHIKEFEALGAAILGVSKDTPGKHQKFIAKYDLAVPLATDEEGVVMEPLDVWVQKSMYGKSYMGIDRSTFLFDAQGVLVRAWRRVKVPGHAAEVLEAVRALA